jgi:hypothetical protein
MSTKTVGSREQVMNGSAMRTSGGLTKSDLKTVKQKDGSVRYVSKRKSQTAAKMRAQGTLRNDAWVEAVKTVARQSPGLTAPEYAKMAKTVYAKMKKNSP